MGVGVGVGLGVGVGVCVGVGVGVVVGMGVRVGVGVGVGYEADVHFFQSSSHINYRQAELDSPQNDFHQSQGANTQVEI